MPASAIMPSPLESSPVRTTLDIDDDLLAAAKELSRQQGRTAGQVVSALLRLALAGGDRASPAAGPAAALAHGFRPFASRGAPVTNSAIDALRDAEGL
jgi:hypothetical protein